MRRVPFKLSLIAQSVRKECGQEPIEYAHIVALIAFAATARMKSLAAGLNTAFSNVGTTLGSYA